MNLKDKLDHWEKYFAVHGATLEEEDEIMRLAADGIKWREYINIIAAAGFVYKNQCSMNTSKK